MPNYWLVKTKPGTYSYDHLEREQTAGWDGVQNPVGLRSMPSSALSPDCPPERGTTGATTSTTAAR